MNKHLQFIFLFVFISNPIYSQIIHVPSDQPTIQAGIDVATDGDTILIADGIYSGNNNINLNWNGTAKHIVIKSENGSTHCVLDCNYEGRGFILDSEQDNRDIIDGLTITNGWAKTVSPILSGGGAILCDGTSPQIINCHLIHNIAGDSVNSILNSYFADGGAIDCINLSAPIIKNNIIRHNFANHTGGGSHFGDQSSGIVENNIIDNNRNYGCYGGGGIALVMMSHPFITNNQITNNTVWYYSDGGYGGGIICLNSNPFIVNNTIANNSTLNGGLLGQGGGIRIRGLPSPIIKNCIIWNNEAQDSLENLDFQYPQWTLDISYSNIEGGIYNINTTSPATLLNSDPNFFDPNNGNFQLSPGSPCIDMGTPDTTGLSLPEYDLAGNPRITNGRIDMGAFEYNPGSDMTHTSVINLSYRMEQNYPNPFNPTTVLRYSLPRSGNVSLKIFNLAGKEIETLVNETKQAGEYEILWNAGNLPGGVYICQLRIEEFVKTRKLVLLR